MDNFRFDMTSVGAEDFKTALSLFRKHSSAKVYAYRLDHEGTPENRIVLYWYLDRTPREGVVPFPYPMTLDQAADFVLGWLEHANYGKEPDHDGSNAHGWRLYCEGWGMIGDDHYTFAAIEPRWAMYGK